MHAAAKKEFLMASQTTQTAANPLGYQKESKLLIQFAHPLHHLHAGYGSV